MPVSAASPRVLVVDDEADLRAVVADVLAAEPLRVLQAPGGRRALELIATDPPTVMILDLKMPEVGGMEVLRQLQTLAPKLPVIVLTGVGDVRTAVAAMRLGAYDYVPKPFDPDELIQSVRRALERQALLAEVTMLRDELAQGGGMVALAGASREIQDVLHPIRQVAGSLFTVIVQGETGTGKELVARAIHQESPRRAGPFVAVDCGAIPDTLIESELFGYEKGAFTGADRRKEGYFQLADGGTLFLDEILNLPVTTQSKLLRALQQREIWPLGARAAVAADTRIIAATNVPLEAEAKAGRFRADLYYRLNEFTITLPPLRVRRDDILPLAKRFMEEASVELKRHVRDLTPEAASMLLDHGWPGNVRELRNVMRRAVLLSTDLVGREGLGDLKGASSGPERDLEASPRSLREAREKGIAEAEQRAIRWALTAAAGNKSEAARLLATDFKTLHVKMKQYGIGLSGRLPN